MFLAVSRICVTVGTGIADGIAVIAFTVRTFVEVKPSERRSIELCVFAQEIQLSFVC